MKGETLFSIGQQGLTLVKGIIQGLENLNMMMMMIKQSVYELNTTKLDDYLFLSLFLTLIYSIDGPRLVVLCCLHWKLTLYSICVLIRLYFYLFIGFQSHCFVL